MKKAFTLVELLVVIGILAILVSVLLVSINGGTESARAAKCLTNMRNLAAACQTYGMATGKYPRAGSYEQMGIDESRGIGNLRKVYYETRGWISWDSQQAYDSSPQSHVANGGWFTSAYNQDYETREYALTNGALWKYVSGNRDIFVCPSHLQRRLGKTQPIWSYVMNCAFGWDETRGNRPMSSAYNGIEYGKLARAEKRLLFAELPFTDTIGPPSDDEGSGIACDCTLQYKNGLREYIGFNHGKGSRGRYAHVVFADGHTERLTLPKRGLGSSEAYELTALLCDGKDVSFNGRTYEELR